MGLVCPLRTNMCLSVKSPGAGLGRIRKLETSGSIWPIMAGGCKARPSVQEKGEEKRKQNPKLEL